MESAAIEASRGSVTRAKIMQDQAKTNAGTICAVVPVEVRSTPCIRKNAHRIAPPENTLSTNPTEEVGPSSKVSLREKLIAFAFPSSNDWANTKKPVLQRYMSMVGAAALRPLLVRRIVCVCRACSILLMGRSKINFQVWLGLASHHEKYFHKCGSQSFTPFLSQSLKCRNSSADRAFRLGGKG